MNPTEVLIGMGAVATTALLGAGLYRWRQRRRAEEVRTWLEHYLRNRFGRLPDHLTIDCSDDRLWPALVRFHDPATGRRHRLQFSCGGQPAEFALLNEIDESASPAVHALRVSEIEPAKV